MKVLLPLVRVTELTRTEEELLFGRTNEMVPDPVPAMGESEVNDDDEAVTCQLQAAGVAVKLQL